jgi:hypothetical protein
MTDERLAGIVLDSLTTRADTRSSAPSGTPQGMRHPSTHAPGGDYADAERDQSRAQELESTLIEAIRLMSPAQRRELLAKREARLRDLLPEGWTPHTLASGVRLRARGRVGHLRRRSRPLVPNALIPRRNLDAGLFEGDPRLPVGVSQDMIDRAYGWDQPEREHLLEVRLYAPSGWEHDFESVQSEQVDVFRPGNHHPDDFHWTKFFVGAYRDEPVPFGVDFNYHYDLRQEAK